MLPEKFLARMQQQLGDEYDEYLRSLQRPRAVALRFNPLKGAIPALPFVGEPVPWEPMGYYYDPDSRPGLHPYHEAGVYYLQEASAMASAALLEPQPGEIILDLCAAPGGKSTQIAGRMQGQGLLVSNEIHPKRAKILSRNIERLGIGNAVVTGEAPAALADRFPGFFHRIMVDAPCSGEGMFRKEEAAITDWSEENVEMCARRQAEILDCAAAMLRPGGRLVYSTCTFAPQEDEETVEAFLARHPEFEAEPVNAPPGSRRAARECTGCGLISCWARDISPPCCVRWTVRKPPRHGNQKSPSVCPTLSCALPRSWTFSFPRGRPLPSAIPCTGCPGRCRRCKNCGCCVPVWNWER